MFKRVMRFLLVAREPMAMEIISSKMTGFYFDIFLIAKQYAYFYVQMNLRLWVYNIAIKIKHKKNIRYIL